MSAYQAHPQVCPMVLADRHTVLASGSITVRRLRVRGGVHAVNGEFRARAIRCPALGRGGPGLAPAEQSHADIIAAD